MSDVYRPGLEDVIATDTTVSFLDLDLPGNRSFHEARVPLSPIFTQWFVSIVVITKIYGCS